MWDIFFLIAQLIVHNKVFVSIQGMFFLIVYDLYGYHYPAQGSLLHVHTEIKLT